MFCGLEVFGMHLEVYLKVILTILHDKWCIWTLEGSISLWNDGSEYVMIA